jgi:outer membrane protein assembly factor BamE
MAPRFKIAAQMALAGLLVLSLAAQSGCQFPRLYRITVQQGNVLTQEMINQLKPGMTRSQVAFVMGDPILKNTFDENKWDYIYTVDLPGYYQEQKHVSLFFTGDVLAYMTGDLAPQTEAEIEGAKQKADAAKAKAEAAAQEIVEAAAAEAEATEEKKQAEK